MTQAEVVQRLCERPEFALAWSHFAARLGDGTLLRLVESMLSTAYHAGVADAAAEDLARMKRWEGTRV